MDVSFVDGDDFVLGHDLGMKLVAVLTKTGFALGAEEGREGF